MTPEQASSTLKMFIEIYDPERAITQKVLAALPDSGADYKPDPKARTAVQLAYHLANSDTWFLHSIAGGEFIPSFEEKIPDELSKPSAIAGWYMSATAEALDKVKRISPEQAAKVLDFFGIFQLPAAMYMNFMLNHMIHHRGQLSSYLRAAGGKCPDIYGGSADEPFKG